MSAEYVEDYKEKKNLSKVSKEVLDRTRVKIHEEVDRVIDRIGLDLEEKV
jgi:hypothetical protein